MNLKFLLDTNVVSEPLRPRPNEQVIRRMRRHETELAITSIVWHELLYGMERLPHSKRRDVIHDYLYGVVKLTIPILDYNEAAAEWHARERAGLAKVGQTAPFVDGQIAAVAHAYELTLVTFNDADFRRFSGLRIATWG